MSTTPVAQPHHLSRKAVIYIRQSTGHQVLTNTESQQLQHAMRAHARHLGWPEERIEVVETDLGRSAQSTAGRDGYKALLADVALGQVGIVLSYESTRLSRNCTDWYPLLDLCAYNLSIRLINFPVPKFQAARRVKHLTLVVAGYPLVTLTGMSADAGFPRRRHS